MKGKALYSLALKNYIIGEQKTQINNAARRCF